MGIGAGTVLVHAGDKHNRFAKTQKGYSCWRSGVRSDGGAWCYFSLRSENGFNEVKVWASNPEEASKIDTTGFQIGSIREVKYAQRRDDRSGKFYPDVSIEAEFLPYTFTEEELTKGYIDTEAISEDELPFN